MNQILESIKPVIKNSEYVKIDKEKILEFCENFNPSKVNHYITDSPFDLSNLNEHEKLNFLLVFNSVNFCYWGEPKWTIEYQGKRYDGAWGMIGALRRAIDTGKPVLDSEYLTELSIDDLEEILKGNTMIPLFNERWKNLRETGTALSNKFDGNFGNVVKLAEGDTLKLLEIIITQFPSFNDSTIHDGQKVFFHKRAQLLISDIHRTFSGKGYGDFKNIEKLTAFADYKIPQVLRKIGILVYSRDLRMFVNNRTHIPKGSEEETEIRANMIWAIELIKQQLKTRFPEINSMNIDNYLWFLGQNKSPEDKPYHLTRTIFY